MLADRVLDEHITARHRRRDHVRPRLDAIRDDRIVRRAQFRHAVNLDAIRSRTADARPHHIEIVREINDLRLERRILKNRLSLGAGRRHHHILRRPDTREIEVDARPLEPVRRTRVNRALRDLDLRPECLKALEMQIDRARPNGAAARQGDFRVSLARKQRTHDEK